MKLRGREGIGKWGGGGVGGREAGEQGEEGEGERDGREGGMCEGGWGGVILPTLEAPRGLPLTSSITRSNPLRTPVIWVGCLIGVRVGWGGGNS